MNKVIKRVFFTGLMAVFYSFLLCACSKPIEVQIQEQLDLGQKYLTEMNYEQAVIAFTKVIELDEKNIVAYKALAESLKYTGNLEEADQAYQKLIDLHMSEDNYQEAASLLIVEGNSNLEKGDHDRALYYYRRLLEINPDNEAGYEREARVYEAQGELLKAITIIAEGYNNSDSISPEYRDYCVSLFKKVKDNQEISEEDIKKIIDVGEEILKKDQDNKRLKYVIHRQLVAKIMRKKDFLSYKDITVNGRQIVESSLEDWKSAYPSYQHDFNGLLFGGNTYHFRQKLANGSILGNLRVYYEEGSQNIRSAHFTKKNEGELHSLDGSWESIDPIFEPEIRGIRMGDNMEVVLEKLGINNDFVTIINQYDNDPEFYVNIREEEKDMFIDEMSFGGKEQDKKFYDVYTGFGLNWARGYISIFFGFNKNKELSYIDIRVHK